MVSRLVRKTAKKLKLNVSHSMLEGLELTGYEDEYTTIIIVLSHILRKTSAPSLAPILPAIFSIKGTPMTLDDHFPFEPFFSTQMPTRMLAKAGRQIGKTQSMSARQILQAGSMPYYSILTVTPLFEMVRRFSTMYVSSLLDECPVKELWVGKKSINSVLHKKFKNRSSLHYSYAFLNCDRVRGLSVSAINYDEIQDLDKDFIPIINETISGSKYESYEQFTGTPKTLDNTMEALWADSSQAEFIIKCHTGGCGYWNFPSIKFDLEAMTGPVRDDISPDRPGLVCAKCQKPINPKLHGRWYHLYEGRKWDFQGLHMPQHIFPTHYGNPKKWQLLLDKRDGKRNTPTFVYHNEVCGESSDTGAQLLSEIHLKRACCLGWPAKIIQAEEHIDDYEELFLAVDWGGGGQERTSWTKMAVLGFNRVDEKIDVIYGVHSLTPNDEIAETKLTLALLRKFRCRWLVHDYSNAGGTRERMISLSGFPANRIVPISYVSAAVGPLFNWIDPTDIQRGFYQADKTRTLQLAINQIKAGRIRFFDYDYISEDDPGMIRDFLSLVADRRDTAGRSEKYFIVRKRGFSDDFAQAVNIGTLAIYNRYQAWPDLTGLDLSVGPEELPELYNELTNLPNLLDLY